MCSERGWSMCMLMKRRFVLALLRVNKLLLRKEAKKEYDRFISTTKTR